MVRPVGNEMVSAALHSKSLPQMKEFDNTSADTIQSAAAEKKEGWGECMTRLLCFIPNMLWVATTTLVYFASCRTLCKPDIDPAQVLKALKPVVETLKDGSKSKADREKARDGLFSELPRVKGHMADAYVAKIRDAKLGGKDKDKADEIKGWNAQNAERVRKEFNQKLDNCDASLFASYMNLQQSRVDDSAAAS